MRWLSAVRAGGDRRSGLRSSARPIGLRGWCLRRCVRSFLAVLTGGALAISRVQAIWEIRQPDGALLQVRYLANPAGRWVNEHLVQAIPGVDWYALVLFDLRHFTYGSAYRLHDHQYELAGELRLPHDIRPPPQPEDGSGRYAQLHGSGIFPPSNVVTSLDACGTCAG